MKTNDFVYFGSGMNKEMSKLSNFCRSHFKYKGIVWPSAEHAFQAILKLDKSEWHRFSVDGEFGKLGEGQDYWGPKKNGKLEMIGIVAKKTVKILKNKKQTHSLHEMYELFLKILIQKYKQNENHRNVLLGTGNKTLIEFSRSAKRESLKARVPFWTGLVDDEGKMWGKNVQGEMQMVIRGYFTNRDT
ncbi:NADAR family protein [Flavobacteriaceae bacterium]|nr:NADAR family protein [Flavobacteriaceae bacterium]